MTYESVHAAPEGPGDARPTAMQIIEDEKLINQLTDKVFIITGGSSGIGIETARAIYATGALVYITARDLKKGQEVADDIKASLPNSKGKIDVLKLELDSLQSVRDCAADFLGKSKQLNVLINNAGIMACPEGKTKDGFELQFGTNHLGHFLLFQLLKPTLLASSNPSFHSRVVCLSSSAHKRSSVLLDDLDFSKSGYDPWKSYGQSKTSNIWMATEIERRYGSKGLHANAVHPGGIRTNLQRHMDPDIMSKMLDPYTKHMKSPEQGAATTVWAATAKQWEGTGGKFLEDCSVSKPFNPETDSMLNGYAPHAYLRESAQELWELSNKLVGTSD
ncbi:g9278 [Coccomyxa elongata]